MGFLYYGPIDGHDIEKLIDVLRLAQKLNQPVLVHVITKKGKGYPFAEKDPKAFHGVSSFDVETGEALTSSESFSEAFGVLMCCLAEADERVCAITAAMKPGTGLSEFARIYKERFFDVGIAEEHAVTFAGGLAAGGMLPVFAVYSTFLQRSYDQIIHDAALQNVKVTLAIDRAGIVGEDGETHQGIFDVAFLNSIPNVTVYSPCYFDELGPQFSQCFVWMQRGSGGAVPPRWRAVPSGRISIRRVYLYALGRPFAEFIDHLRQAFFFCMYGARGISA